jgi:hypothetical protein
MKVFAAAVAQPILRTSWFVEPHSQAAQQKHAFHTQTKPEEKRLFSLRPRRADAYAKCTLQKGDSCKRNDSTALSTRSKQVNQRRFNRLERWPLGWPSVS